ncbi:lipase 3-like [Vespa mandarinia]|uniref:lipase 3-like n=1 Tax=Vespa mandarinia TaxID=7446 RepID=UPI001617136C|nr:lipase 3-like [Vespa mandarinia]
MKLILLTILLLFDCCLGRTSSFSLLKYILSSNKNELKKVRSESELNGDDTVLDFIGLVQRHGYPAEEHKVTTDDGYILTMHRIPNSPLSDINKKKDVVFVQHGMTASSDSWVLLEPKKNLPFLLADTGYDVWLGNFRGNTYCRSHVNLTTNDRKFWEFSYHDIGLHDTPQYIDYVLNYTESKKLFYIGHSMGTSVSYVMLSMKPSYNDKMRLVISLAPVSYFKHKFPPGIERIIKDVPKIKRILEAEGIYDILSQSKMMKLLGAKLCNEKSIFHSICASVLYLVSGRDTMQTNTSLIPYFLNYIPAGVSTQSLFHYYQNYLTGNFEAYDYGYEGNLIHYKKVNPPVYDIKKIIAPLALFYGINDVLTNDKDAIELSKKLSNVVTCEAVPYECFSHLDFVIANDVKALLYDRLLDLMKQFIELAKQNGYFAEEHTVVTEDGYTILFHRIPYSPVSNITYKIRPIILMQPGAFASSDYWILYGSKRSLPCSLADAGFDVWLGNARGNVYGQTHVKFSSKDKEFMQFSYHEIAIYDVPAIIDYILNYTKSEKLYFIGHSMGTTLSYVLLSMKPDYNEKIRLVISLAPTAYWKKEIMSPLLKFIITYSSIPKFQSYDYGYEYNMKLYKQKVPLEYDLTRISAPVALIYGKNDILVPNKFLVELYKKLPNIHLFEVVPYDHFNHIDFITARNVKELLNDRIIDLLKHYLQ